MQLYRICGGCQLGSGCSNCMSFEVRGPLLALLQVREFWIIWNFLTGSRLGETRHELSMVRTHNNLKCYSSVCVVFLYRVSMRIKMNSIKINVIINWKVSRNLKDVQTFFDFVNFYRKFNFQLFQTLCIFNQAH